jgi:hypothetical protein
MRTMETTIYKEEFINPNIWQLILIELGLEPETDEITITAIKKESNNDNG